MLYLSVIFQADNLHSLKYTFEISLVFRNFSLKNIFHTGSVMTYCLIVLKTKLQKRIFADLSGNGKLLFRYIFLHKNRKSETHFFREFRIRRLRLRSLMARPARFERAAFRLGGTTYPLEGVCNVRFLHKIRIFRDFRKKTKLFSVTFTDSTASHESVAPFIQNRTKALSKTRPSASFSVSIIYSR